MPRVIADRPRLFDAVCERLATGQSLRAACEPDGMPSPQTVLQWVKEDTVFAEQYARARELGYALMADQIIEIADQAVDKENAAAIKVRTDVRQWMLARMLPKIYGDKSTVDVNVSTNLADRMEAARKRRRSPTIEHEPVPPALPPPEVEE